MSAICLHVIPKSNLMEIKMEILWMFIGITLYGYAICNISCSLWNSVKEEQDYLDVLQY